jgi:NodT family efflux transporter outer membrane factor (OMF) lipoprotein
MAADPKFVRAPIQRLALALLLGLSACAAGPNYRTPPPDVPASFVAPSGLTGSGGATTAGGALVAADAKVTNDLSTWWHNLHDAQLDRLVERAIHSNLDLEIALTRLQQARTFEAVILGAALPRVEASAGAGRGTGSDLTRGRAAQNLVAADSSAGLQHINEIGGFDAAWELDLFGKYRREWEAARADVQAAAAARAAVLTSIVADVVRAYVDLRGLQMQAAILHKADAVLRESVRVTGIRYERGIVNELDLSLAKRELGTLEARIAPVEAQVRAAQFALAVLVGEYPETLLLELSIPAEMPQLPAVIRPGAPVELLHRRSDIRAAERELAGATARIGVATANLFPQIALTGAVGAQAQGWGTSPGVGKHIWSFGPAAIWPLLDFGALDAQVDIAHLEAHASLVKYRSIILNAVEEVDTAIDAYAAEQTRLQNLGDALVAAQRAAELAHERYERGLTDFLNVVDAERQLYDIEEQYALSQVSEAEQLVKLYKGLGGGWEAYQDVPPIRRPQPAVIAALRRALSPSTP